MATSEAAQVLVVGAGPVGLALAAFLAQHGVRCRIIDKLAEPVPYCRAIGVTPRTLEIWDDLGIAREAIGEQPSDDDRVVDDQDTNLAHDVTRDRCSADRASRRELRG